jgi:hypothetical protein
MAFPDDCWAIGLHGNTHPGDIDGEKGPAVFPGQHAFGFDDLPAPAVEPEDPIGLRDRVPALDIRELSTMDLAGNRDYFAVSRIAYYPASAGFSFCYAHFKAANASGSTSRS